MSTPQSQADAAVTAMEKPGILKATFLAFQYRNFRLIWTGAFTSTSGFFVQEVAQSLLVWDLTKDPFLLTLPATLNGLPILLFTLLGGVAADRMDRRKLLAISQYIQMASALTLAVLLWLDMIAVWHIMAAAFVSGVGQAFGGPAFQALIPSLVEKKDLPNGIALMTIQFPLAMALGSSIGGIVYATLGAAACFGINAVTFLAVIVALLFVRVRFIPQRSEAHVLHSLKEGVGFVFRHHALSALIVLSSATAFLALPLSSLLLIFARETYHLDAQGYGFMRALYGAGAVAGALVVAWLGNASRKGWRSLLMQLGLGGATLCFALSNDLWIACFFVFFAGAGFVAVFAMISSLVQLLAPEEMRGRIMSVQNTAFRGAMPLGNAAAGALAKQFGAPLILAVNGGVLTLIAAWYLLRDRAVARL